MYNKYVKGERPLFNHLHGSSWHGDDAKSVLWILHHPIFLALLTLTGMPSVEHPKTVVGLEGKIPTKHLKAITLAWEAIGFSRIRFDAVAVQTIKKYLSPAYTCFEM